MWVQPAKNLFLFSNRAVFWLAHGAAAEKRQVLATVGSNLTLKAKKLSIDADQPFLVLQKSRETSDWWRVVNDVRTFFTTNPTIVIPLLPEPNFN